MEPSEDLKDTKYEIRDALESDIESISNIYEEVFTNKPNKDYFLKFLKVSKNPFLVAINEKKEIIGYIACRINEEENKLYVASIAVKEKYAYNTIEANLIDVSSDYAKKNKYKYIGTHIRGTNTKLRTIFKNKGFYEQLVGKFKNMDDKYLLMKEYKYNPIAGEPTKYKVTRLQPEPFKWGYFQAMKPKIILPEPKEGYYEIVADMKYSDVSKVTTLHNKYMGKERKGEYFYKIYTNKNNPFYLARDSNGTIIGYLAARIQTKPSYYTKEGKRMMSQSYDGVKNRINFISMAVSERWRGKGIAKKLIQKLFDYANKNKNIEVIFGHVRGKNIGAINLYKSMGFKTKVIGYYEDTKELKYEIYKRIRLPDMKPFVRKHYPKAAYTAYFVLLHELLHKFRNYEN